MRSPDDQAAPPRRILTPSMLNRLVRGLLEDALPLVWIEGELSNVARPASGHLYFTLKEGQRADLEVIATAALEWLDAVWPAPGSEDTKFGVTMGPEVGHGEAEVYAGVQA